MALSGSFSGSIKSGNYKLRVDWSATQSVANNTSKITAVMYLVQSNSWSLSIGTRSNSTSISGTSYSWSSPAISNGGGKTTKLATVTSGNISHNADGTKSVTISATFNIQATISGTYYGSITASSTVTLDTIPRATTPKLSSTSVNMGDAVTITMDRASSSFTHDLAYKFGNESTWRAIATDRGTSYSWTVPDRATDIPNATSGTMTVRCITKNGSTTVGTKTVTLTAKVPSNVVPTVSAVTVAEATAGLAAQFGAYIQGKSKLSVNITGAGAKGSTITAYSTTLLGKTYTARSWTSPLLTGKGSISLVTKVKDSRGRWSAGKTTTITVLAYEPPKIQKLSVYRCNSSGVASSDGIYVAVEYQYSVTALNNKNTAAMTVDYKRSTATEWASLLTGTALSANTTAKPASPTLSSDYSFDVRLTIKDWFNATQTYITTLPSAAVILDLLASGKGIGIGKTAEQEGIDFGWDLVRRINVMGSLAGRYRTDDGLLLQWGTVTITPSAANEATTAAVTFPLPYTETPTVFATPISSVPNTLSVSVQRGGDLVPDNKLKVAITLVRNGLTATGINWLAIGKG